MTAKRSISRTKVRHGRASGWLLGILVTLLGGCGDDCEEPVIGMSIRLLGGATGGSCGLSVVISKEGAKPGTLSCRAEANDCLCEGARNQPGTYQLSIQRGSTVIETSSIVVEEDACEFASAEFSV